MQVNAHTASCAPLEQSWVYLSIETLAVLILYTLELPLLKVGLKDGMPLVLKLAELISPLAIAIAIFVVYPVQIGHMRVVHAQLV